MKELYRHIFRVMLIAFWGLPTCLNAESNEIDCKQMQKWLNAPDYYCDCHDAIPFRYGLDMVISDTTWFSATVNDVRQGLTAYWFAENGVTFDIFPTCLQDAPTMSFTIGKNRAYNMDADELQKRLEEHGGIIGETIASMTVRIRVAPHDGVTGRAVLTSYDKGHHSLCDNPLPVCWNSRYVLSDPDNVYLLSLTSDPKQMLVRWKQQNNLPVRVEVTRGSCDGEVVASALLADSSKVWLPELSLLQHAYASEESLYFHFYSQHTGSVWFVSPFTTKTVTEDIAACQGKGWVLADTTLLESTVYCDTVYEVDATTGVGTLWIKTLNLTIAPPVKTVETLVLTEFPYLYRGQFIVWGYGDYNVFIQEDGECDEDITLHVVASPPTALSDDVHNIMVTPLVARVGQMLSVIGTDNGYLQVFSLLGENILSMPLTDTMEFSLSVVGQYIVRVQTEQGMIQTKIIIL